MGFGDWMKTIGMITDLVQTGAQFGRRAQSSDLPAASSGALGGLETRLTGVVISALKEAFDRDSARLELEREQLDTDRRRAEQALQAELRRQAADRALAQIRFITTIAAAVWMLSAALAVWLPGMRAGVPRIMLGLGWAASFATLGSGFAGWQQISAWSADVRAAASAAPRFAAAIATPWLLLLALALTALSLLIAL